MVEGQGGCADPTPLLLAPRSSRLAPLLYGDCTEYCTVLSCTYRTPVLGMQIASYYGDQRRERLMKRGLMVMVAHLLAVL